MPGKLAILTPYSRTGEAQRVGRRLFRKKLLPVGTIDYDGQTVRFDEPYLREIVNSFEQEAYDQVPFQLANDKNQHTNDPERTRGEVVALDLQSDGLYMTVSTTEEGAKVITENPKLGISARIVNGLQRADGKSFKAALQHALGTLDPRINGLGPWEAIEASSTGEPVLDFTESAYREAEDVADFTPDEVARLKALLAEPSDETDELTDEELNELIAAADELAGEGGDDELSDEEIEAILAEAAAGVEEPELEEVAASVDPATQRALELTSAQLSTQRLELSRVTSALDAGRFEQERDMFMRDYGIPPAIIDLARPVLEGENHTFELSNGDVSDAGAVMRQVLTAIGQQVKLMDLSSELGSSVSDGDHVSNDATMALVRQFRSQSGI